MPESDRGDAAVARLDLVAPPAPAAPASSSSCATTTATARDEDEQEEDGFTFAAVAVAVPSPQAADCAIPDAQVSPVYPVFGRARWSPPEQHQQAEDPAAAGTGTATVRMPLGRLLLQDRWCDYAPSPSRQQQQPADDADAELDGVPAETYCLWSPGASPPPASAGFRRSSPARCPKIVGSPGSPVLRWRRRRQRVVVSPSHNSDDGKDKFVLVGASSVVPGSAGEGHGRWMNRRSGARGGGKSTTTTTSFLPCKQDLVGLVASAVAFPRSYLPF